MGGELSRADASEAEGTENRMGGEFSQPDAIEAEATERGSRRVCPGLTGLCQFDQSCRFFGFWTG